MRRKTWHDFNSKTYILKSNNIHMRINSDIWDSVGHADQGIELCGGNDFVFGALASTLYQILIQANALRLVALLSLDVERIELEVLKGIKHLMFYFRFTCVESRNINKLIR